VENTLAQAKTRTSKLRKNKHKALNIRFPILLLEVKSLKLLKRNKGIGRTFAGITLDFDMDEVYVIELPLKKGKPYAEVMFKGDIHLGHPDFSYGHLKRYLKLLRDNKHIRIVGMGDYIEAVEFSPSFLQEPTLRTREQIELLIKLFEPIKDQIIALLYGNHDERIQKAMKMAIDLLEHITLKLGKPNIVRGRPQKGLLLVFKVGNQTYPVYVHHSKTGAIIHADTQLRRTSMNWMVPLLVHGHTHRKGWQPRTFFSVTMVNGQPMRSVLRQFWLSSGAFLRYPSYAEARSYPVTDIGAPIIRFYADVEGMEYIDPLIHREYQKYFRKEEKSTLEELRMKTKNKHEKVEEEIQLIPSNRPPCPRCNSHNIMSRGSQWYCKDCGRYYIKRKK